MQINEFFDRDIEAQMTLTRYEPWVINREVTTFSPTNNEISANITAENIASYIEFFELDQENNFGRVGETEIQTNELSELLPDEYSYSEPIYVINKTIRDEENYEIRFNPSVYNTGCLVVKGVVGTLGLLWALGGLALIKDRKQSLSPLKKGLKEDHIQLDSRNDEKVILENKQEQLRDNALKHYERYPSQVKKKIKQRIDINSLKK